MSSKTVTKHKKTREHLLPCFFACGTDSASLCNALRCRISFAFAARRSVGAGAHDSPFVRWIFRVVEAPTPTIRRRACESRSEAELPECHKRTTNGRPYKRYFTFFEKYAIISEERRRPYQTACILSAKHMPK